MRRSVLVRFLGLSLAVALGAVIATAVIATYSTSEKLQGEIDANTGQLQVDGEIYGQLSKYAADHPTWSGVDKLVHELGDKLGRRVAVTTDDGSVIADSARMLGAAPALPSVPAATIDVRNTAVSKFFSSMNVYSARKAVAAGQSGGFVATTALVAPYGGFPDWGMTDEEARQRDKLAQQAVDCLNAKGKTASVTQAAGLLPQVMIESKESLAGVQVKSSALPKDDCTPPGLTAPSAKAKVVNNDEIRRAATWLDAAGLSFNIIDFGGV
jgi:two-component system sensor histidine kinase BaeS